MILFDTNILVYSRNKKDERNKTCLKWIEKVERGEIGGVVSSQNLVEFAAVMSNLAELYKKIDGDDIRKFLANFEEDIFQVIYPNGKTLLVFNELVEKYRVDKKGIFDLFLVATMLSNGVRKILTYNKKDFEGVREVGVVEPEKEL